MAIFEDNPKRNLIEDARIWISGVEVTARLTSSVTISIMGRGSYNTATFTMSNASDGFILNERNIDTNLSDSDKFVTGGNPAEHSEAIKKAIFLHKDDSVRNPVDPQTGERRWPLVAHSLVLHAMDPVFVVGRWPYTADTLYYPAFKGYIETKPTNEDFPTGKSNITVTCFGIRAPMGKMRAQMNYNIMSTFTQVSGLGGEVSGSEEFLNAFDPTVQAGFFRDLQKPSAYTTPIAGMSLKDSIEFLVTGEVTETDEIEKSGFSFDLGNTVIDNSRDDVSKNGIGEMRTGIVVSYPAGDGESREDVKILEEWHRLCLFGVPIQDKRNSSSVMSTEAEDAAAELNKELPEEDGDALDLTPGQKRLFRTNSRPWTAEEAEDHGNQCVWGGSTAPDAMSIHFLLPSDGGGMNGITQYTRDAGSSERKWQSRLSIIEEYLETLDYHWFVTGAGDIVVEFPMYDFEPSRFGEFEEAFTIRFDGEGKSLTFDDDRPNVPTAMVVTAGYNPNVESVGQLVDAALGESEATVLRVIMYAPVLAARIGMTIEKFSMPFALDDICRLRQFAVLRFQRKLAEANTMAIDFIYRPLLTPNRPILETRRGRMGWTSQVTSSVPPSRMEFGHATTSVVTKYVRKPGVDDNGNTVYRLITGSSTMPLSYNGSGPGMNASRGILIGDTGPNDFDLDADPCDGSTTGAPSADYGLIGGTGVLGTIYEDTASENCSKSPDDLAGDVKALWEMLRDAADRNYSLKLKLTCTSRSILVETNEMITPDLHQVYPARAFDISITRWDGNVGTAEDYNAVGNLGVSLGLQWGGDIPSFSTTPSIDKIQNLIIGRAKFHVSRGTPYIYGGSFNKTDASPKNVGCDCSGFIIDCYREAGIIGRDDRTTAAGLQAMFPATKEPRPGDMVFAGKNNTSHVAMIAESGNPDVYGASGGSQGTDTIAIADSKNAKVKFISGYVGGIRTDIRGYATPYDDLTDSRPALAHFSLS